MRSVNQFSRSRSLNVPETSTSGSGHGNALLKRLSFAQHKVQNHIYAFGRAVVAKDFLMTDD
jgi:hypothetical protein